MITKEEAQAIVKDLLNNAQSRFKKELIGENEEILDRVLRQHRSEVARYSWKLSQKWSRWDDDGPVLMPDYTRIYYRKGKTEVILQEFPPQVRLLKFKGGLLREGSSDPLDQKDHQKIYHFSLALPYVVFIFKFVDGMFSAVKCAFCDRPLKRLEERPLRPYLSNIDSTLDVCLGAALDRNQLIRGQLAQQIAYILSHFWHSAYSDEWSAHYWSNKSHFVDINDKRMSTLQNWQEASQENSLFVVEDVSWLQHDEESFGDMIVKMFHTDSEDQKFQEDIYNELVDSFFENIKKAIHENVTMVADKISEKQIAELTGQLLTKLNN